MADKNIRLECEVNLSHGVRLNDWDEYYTKRDTDALLARKQDKLANIPGYDASKVQTLKNINGVFQWIDD